MAQIKVRCKSCKAMLKFPSAKAGKRVRCPECDEIVRVPEEEADAPPREAIKEKKAAAPPPVPTPAPAPVSPGDDDEDEGPKTYGVIAPEARPSLEDDKPKPKKKEKVDFKGRIKKRVIQDADEWQKVNSAFMLAFIGALIMMLAWLFNFFGFVNGWLFNNISYSIAAESLLIRKVGNPVHTGGFKLIIGKSKEVDGFIADGDDIDPMTGYPCKIIETKYSAGQKVRIRAESSDFDIFVRVAEKETARTIASDDNSAGNNNALLEFDVPNGGTHHIIVSSSLNVPFEVNRNGFVVALAYGSIERGRILLILSSLVAVAQIGIFMLAYFICMAVPNVNGTRALALSMVVVAIVNLVLIFFFKLLPATGVIGYIMIPFVLPELAMVATNLERMQPLHIFWSSAPFWEMFFALLFSALLHGEVILFCIFLRSVAVALKEPYLEENALGLIKLSFGVLFIFFTYQLVSITGTSAVLRSVLRFIYMIYLGFYLGFAIYLAKTLLTARAKIADLLEPEEGAEQDDGDDEDEDEDEDEDADDDEDDDDDDR